MYIPIPGGPTNKKTMELLQFEVYRIRRIEIRILTQTIFSRNITQSVARFFPFALPKIFELSLKKRRQLPNSAFRQEEELWG